MLTVESVRPDAKLVVPSIGSTTQSQSPSPPSAPVDWSLFLPSSAAPNAKAEAAWPASTDSSPRKPWAGKAALTHASITRWAAPSTSVRRSRGLALVFRTSAPRPARIRLPASRAAFSATASTWYCSDAAAPPATKPSVAAPICCAGALPRIAPASARAFRAKPSTAVLWGSSANANHASIQGRDLETSMAGGGNSDSLSPLASCDAFDQGGLWCVTF
mmetsp:Transcript_68567/g.155068  ORF Transcript_68567/g.155068 Transcript_68567/m.155068 type:complete len:218 (-) Transcript_68567:37-690(-)